MYLNSLLISVITLFGYMMASIIINAVGNKNLLSNGTHKKHIYILWYKFNFAQFVNLINFFFVTISWIVYGLLISGTCGIALNWAPNSTATLLLAAGNISIGSISSSALVSAIVSMFPTATRYVECFKLIKTLILI